ncbi:MAG: PilN domain-containing protein [Deltaproteobacteria bacterium]
MGLVARGASETLPDWMFTAFFGRPVARELVFSDDVSNVILRGKTLVAPTSLLKTEASSSPGSYRGAVIAILPQHYCLERQIEVPAKGLAALASIAELDLTRRTPFRKSDVWWTVSAPTSVPNGFVVSQFVVKRSDVRALSARLALLGLRLTQVRIAGSSVLADLSDTAAPSGRLWRRFNAGLAALGVILAMTLWLNPALVARADLRVLDTALAARRDEAVNLRSQVEVLREQKDAREQFLAEIVTRPRLSNVLRDLTVALPDTVWISDFVFSPIAVVVTGEIAGSAADLVLALSENRQFGNPRLTGPVSQTQEGRERFDLTVDLGGVP